MTRNNPLIVHMREGKSAMNEYTVVLFSHSVLNNPEYWDGWQTSVIVIARSMEQRMWTKLIVLWTPSRKQHRGYLWILLKRPKGNPTAPYALSQTSLRKPFYTVKNESHENSYLVTEVARKTETWVFQDPNLGKAKNKIVSIWHGTLVKRRSIDLIIASQEMCGMHIHTKCLKIQEMCGRLRMTITYLKNVLSITGIISSIVVWVL